MKKRRFWTQDDIGGAEDHEYDERTEYDSDAGPSGTKKEEQFWETEDHEESHKEFEDDELDREGYDKHRGVEFEDESDFHGVTWTLDTRSKSHYLGHERTRLENDEMGILIDPGAHGNLVGENWAKKQAEKASRFGYATHVTPLREPLEVNGVGKGPDYCHTSWKLPIGTQEIEQEDEGAGSLDSYTAPVIPDSEVPALLGNSSLKKLDAIVECGPGILHLCGPGRQKLQLPAGTKSYNLKGTRSGHWLLPCSKFKEAMASSSSGTGYPIDKLQPKSERMDFLTDNEEKNVHFEEPPGMTAAPELN